MLLAGNIREDKDKSKAHPPGWALAFNTKTL